MGVSAPLLQTCFKHQKSLGDGIMSALAMEGGEDKLMKKPCFCKAGKILCANCHCCRHPNGRFPPAGSWEPGCLPLLELEKLPGKRDECRE